MIDLSKMTDVELHELRKKLNSKTLEFPDTTTKGQVRPSKENADALFSHYGIVIRHNEMSKCTEIEIPGANFHSDTEMNAKLAYIRNLYVKHDISDKNLDSYITMIANENAYHPVRDWIDSYTWDGQSRLQEYYDTLVADPDLHINPTEYIRLKETMMRKWALSAVAALYDDNFSCEGVLCLYGDQAAGKTSWCLSLMPTESQKDWFKDAVALEVNNKDSLTKSLGTWITELGEIDATFRKSDIEALKGFITERVDVIRPPYERTANKYRRRTVFIGTMNKLKFLQDDQNRRFWPINVTRVHYADFDIGQFWAEIKAMYQRIKPLCATPQLRKANNEYGWFLNEQERALLDRTQTVFKSDDPIEEMLSNRVMPKLQGMGQEEWLNCTAILDRCGKSWPSKRDLDIVGRWCRQQGYDYKKDTKQYHVWIPIVPASAVNWEGDLGVKMKKLQKMSDK